MDAFLLAARLLLAAVFAVAGVAKLADRAGSSKAITDFGLPVALAAPLGLLLPLAELAVAALLLPVATAWWGALGALLLLAAFVAGIGVNLLRGRKPDCHCFGQLHSEPIGWPTLARNGVLAALAALVVWQGRVDPGPSVLAALAGFANVSFLGVLGGLIALGVFAAQGWFQLHLLRQHGRMLARLDSLETQLGALGLAPTPALEPAAGLPLGTPAPPFALPDLGGTTRTLPELLAPGKPAVLVFSDPDCGPCNALLPDLARWQEQHRGKVTLALVSRGTVDENRAKLAAHDLRFVLLQRDREVAEAYQSHGTPGAVLVHPDGTIHSPLAMGADAIKALVTQATGTWVPVPLPLAVARGNGHHPGAARSASQIGQPAPALSLPDLGGKNVALSDFRGSRTLVLFWNPGCGFCERMLPDLKAWEAKPSPDAPKLLVVSSGAVEANKAMGLRAPVVLGVGFAGGAFGASGTPSAILVDASGNIASEVAVGAAAVLALAGAKPPSASALVASGSV